MCVCYHILDWYVRPGATALLELGLFGLADNIEDRAYTGTPETVLEILRVAYGPYGAKSWLVRKHVEGIIRQVRPRDYWSEALAIYYALCGPQFRYTHDPEKVELVKSPAKMIYEIRTTGVTLGDCDDLAACELAFLSVVGTSARIGTGAFDYHPELVWMLRDERPEKVGFALQGGQPVAPGPFSHVWPEGQRPDRVWVMLDPVAGPYAGQMRRRLRQVRYYQTK